MKKIVVFISLLLCAAFYASAQSSEKISNVIECSEVTKAQTAYLSACYQNLVQDSASFEEAFDVLAQKGIFTEKDEASQSINLEKASFVIVKATGIKGGLFYRMFHNPRYAFKECKAMGIIPANADPAMKVNGHQLIALFNGCVSKSEEK